MSWWGWGLKPRRREERQDGRKGRTNCFAFFASSRFTFRCVSGDGDLRRLTRPQRAADIVSQPPQLLLESVKGPVAGDLNQETAGDYRRHAGQQTTRKTAGDPDCGRQHKHPGEAGGMGGVGFNRMTTYNELRVLRFRGETEVDGLVELTGDEPEDPGSTG